LKDAQFIDIEKIPEFIKGERLLVKGQYMTTDARIQTTRGPAPGAVRICLNAEELELAARVVSAEARNQDTLGRQAVFESILSRMTVADFGGRGNLRGVLNFPNAFTPVMRANGVENLPPAPQHVIRELQQYINE
jgi:hypothetical protein